jgi:hypothetical protein
MHSGVGGTVRIGAVWTWVHASDLWWLGGAGAWGLKIGMHRHSKGRTGCSLCFGAECIVVA